MKWNKKNKWRLFLLLEAHFIKMYEADNPREDFLSHWQIEEVEKVYGQGPWRFCVPAPRPNPSTCICGIGGCLAGCGMPARDNKHVIINDPMKETRSSPRSSGRWSFGGLKIPKDVAEKFLVLGVP